MIDLKEVELSINNAVNDMVVKMVRNALIEIVAGLDGTPAPVEVEAPPLPARIPGVDEPFNGEPKPEPVLIKYPKWMRSGASTSKAVFAYVYQNPKTPKEISIGTGIDLKKIYSALHRLKKIKGIKQDKNGLYFTGK